MIIARRLMRLIKADIHGVLDCIEEPAEVLKQAVREMEDVISSEQRMVSEYQKRLAEIDAKDKEAYTAAMEIESSIRLCLDNSNEELARAMVRKKLENARQAKAICKFRIDLESRASQNARALDEHTQSLAELQEKVKSLPVSATAETSCERSHYDPGAISAEEIEVAFLEELKRYQATPVGAAQ